MTNQDYGMLISQLEKRINILEAKFVGLEAKPNINDRDWDNATLMQELGICERTAAYYRKQGLKYYKRRGRIYYTPEARAEFLERRVNKKSNSPEDLTSSQNSPK